MLAEWFGRRLLDKRLEAHIERTLRVAETANSLPLCQVATAGVAGTTDKLTRRGHTPRSARPSGRGHRVAYFFQRACQPVKLVRNHDRGVRRGDCRGGPRPREVA